MTTTSFKLTLDFISPDYTSEEHLETFCSLQDAVDEADDLAFKTVGFPLEDWKRLDFGDGNQLYLYYPNEDDKVSRYKLSIIEEIE